MNRPRLWIVAGLLVAVFLLGYLPQYLKRQSLESQLHGTLEQINLERSRVRTDELGLMAGRIYLDANQKNYGLASQDATKFFDQVRAMTAQEKNDSDKKQFLEKALAKRDEVTAGLAKGDPSTVPVVQDLFQGALNLSLGRR